MSRHRDEVAFLEKLTVPTIKAILGETAEPDQQFRARILLVCAARDRMLVEIASAPQLDAIGKLHGLTRGGFC